MKCSKCGMELPDSCTVCSRCGSEISRDFNYNNMERELLNTVLEEEAINGMSENSMLDQHKEPEDETMYEEVKKQPGNTDISRLLYLIYLIYSYHSNFLAK